MLRWLWTCLVAIFASLLSIAAPALADAPQNPSVLEANIRAHPALWTVHAKNSTVYLLGSIHLLPTNVIWRTPAIDAAMKASDVFAFEAPMDTAGLTQIADFVRAHGMLPAGTTLPSLLDDESRKDLDEALALTDLPADRVEGMRPWLAAIVLETAYMEHEHYSPDSGVDRQVFAIANGQKKSLRYFETVDQQMQLIVPPDKDLEVKEFDADLKQFKTEMNSMGPLIDAWSAGNAARVGTLMNKDLEQDPGTKKTLLDDRNDAWMVKLDRWLGEHHTYFITVGTGHLVGSHGVPALLKAEGYAVEGP